MSFIEKIKNIFIKPILSGSPLYVIDMQPGFGASIEVIKKVLHEIKLAKKRNDWIIFVELDSNIYHTTHKELADLALKDYDKVKFSTKSISDGSDAFIKEIKDINYNRVRLCGVLRHACVFQTMRGLNNKLPIDKKIEVVWKATAPISEKGKKAYKDIMKTGRVSLV